MRRFWQNVKRWFKPKPPEIGSFHQKPTHPSAARQFIMYGGDELGMTGAMKEFERQTGYKVGHDYDKLIVYQSLDPEYYNIEMTPHCDHEWQFVKLGDRKYGYRCDKCRGTKP